MSTDDTPSLSTIVDCGKYVLGYAKAMRRIGVPSVAVHALESIGETMVESPGDVATELTRMASAADGGK